MTERWKPTDDQMNDIINDYWSDIRDSVNAMIEELGCPKEYAAGMLKAIADDYEDN